MSTEPTGDARDLDAATASDSSGSSSREPTQSELEAQLQRYHEAVRGEFALQNNIENETQELEKSIREFYRDQAPKAAAVIAELMYNAASDGVRLAAAKHVEQMAIETSKLEKSDPVAKLLNELHGPPIFPVPPVFARAAQANQTSIEKTDTEKKLP